MIVYQQHDHINNLHRHRGVLCWTFCAQLVGEKTAALRDKVQDLGETQFSNIRLKIWWGKSKFYQALHDEQFELQNPINFANYSPRLASSNWERWNNILELCTESRFLKKQCKKNVNRSASRDFSGNESNPNARWSLRVSYCTSVQGICGHRTHEYWDPIVESYLFLPSSSSISLLTSYKEWCKDNSENKQENQKIFKSLLLLCPLAGKFLETQVIQVKREEERVGTEPITGQYGSLYRYRPDHSIYSIH
mgnify:CR=1 FL=1